MRAVELKFADGKPTGLWYCSKCREIFRGCTAGVQKKGMSYGNGIPCSETHQEQAEQCCTNKGRGVRHECGGCRRALNQCVCGRAQQNCCVACGAKLLFGEGSKVRWGTEVKEICYDCRKNHPSLKLVDAP